VERRQLGQLDAPAIQERACPDEDGIGPLAAHHFKSGIDLSAGVGVLDLNLQSHGASSRAYVFQLSLGDRVGRINEHSDAGSPRYQLTQEFQPLCRQFRIKNIDSRHVATRSREACDKTKSHRVVANQEGHGDLGGRRLGRECRRWTSGDDCGDLAANQLGCQLRLRSSRFSAKR
jgi:hypothetical protein